MGHYELHQKSQMVERAIAPHEAAVLAAWKAKGAETLAPAAVAEAVTVAPEIETTPQVV